MSNLIYSSKELAALADELKVDLSGLRWFVLARCVVLARDQADSVAVKALELLARLALGDRPPGVDNYAKEVDLSAFSTEELRSFLETAQRATQAAAKARGDDFTDDLRWG